MRIRPLILILLASMCATAHAGKFTIPAAAFTYPAANAATAGCVSSNTNPHCYASFSGSADQYAYAHWVVPIDMHDEASIKCTWIGYDHAGSPDNTAACFRFYGAAYVDGADILAAGSPTASASTCAFTTSTTDSVISATSASAHAILDVDDGNDCGSNTCNDRPLTITIKRTGATDGSDDDVRVTWVNCEY